MERVLSRDEVRFCIEHGVDPRLARGGRDELGRLDPLWIGGTFDDRPIIA